MGVLEAETCRWGPRGQEDGPGSGEAGEEVSGGSEAQPHPPGPLTV